jgi:hypothetical protein
MPDPVAVPLPVVPEFRGLVVPCPDYDARQINQRRNNFHIKSVNIVAAHVRKGVNLLDIKLVVKTPGA